MIRKTYLRFFIFFFAILLSVQVSNAQVRLKLIPQSPVQFSSKSIFHASVIYTGTESLKVRYVGSIQDENGATVAQLVTRTMELKPGGFQLTPQQVNLEQIKYSDKTVQEVERSSGYLPTGNYRYCVRVECRDKQERCESALKAEDLVSDCENVKVRPLTPLRLASPSDEDTIKNKRPVLTWIPPMPIGNDPNIRYELVLVPKNIDQTASAALSTNRTMYKRADLKQVSLPFPNELEDLVEGHQYAWRVRAFIGQRHIATSESWWFAIEKPEEPPKYISLKTKADGGFITISKNGSLFIMYEGMYANELMDCKIYGPDRQEIQLEVNNDDPESGDVENTHADQVMGRHKYAIDLARYNLAPGYYTLMVTDSRNMGHYERLKIQ